MSTPFAAIFWATLVVYALVVAAQLFGQIFQRPAWNSRASYGLLFGAALHTALLAWRWISTGHVPTMGTFENALSGGWFIVAMTLWAGWKQRHPLLAAGALPFALVILGWGGVSDTRAGPLVASLQSFWMYIHVFFAWLAYGAFTVACGAGVVYLAKSRRGQNPPPQALARLEELMFRSTVFGFITDAVMIAGGAIWAKKLWGSYWSWDPVETWSLLSWLTYGLALHLRATLRWRGRRLAWVLVFAIITVLMTYWGVNLVMTATAHTFNVG